MSRIVAYWSFGTSKAKSWWFCQNWIFSISIIGIWCWLFVSIFCAHTLSSLITKFCWKTCLLLFIWCWVSTWSRYIEVRTRCYLFMVTFRSNYKLSSYFVLPFYWKTGASCLLHLNRCIRSWSWHITFTENSSLILFWTHMEFRSFSNLTRCFVNAWSWNFFCAALAISDRFAVPNPNAGEDLYLKFFSVNGA